MSSNRCSNKAKVLSHFKKNALFHYQQMFYAFLLIYWKTFGWIRCVWFFFSTFNCKTSLIYIHTTLSCAETCLTRWNPNLDVKERYKCAINKPSGWTSKRYTHGFKEHTLPAATQQRSRAEPSRPETNPSGYFTTSRRKSENVERKDQKVVEVKWLQQIKVSGLRCFYGDTL